MIKKLALTLTATAVFANFYVGVGGFSACPSKYGSSYYKRCPYPKQRPLYDFLPKETPNVNAVSIWITRGWKEFWYPAKTVNSFIKKGYTPVFIFYWFGDDISKEFVTKNKKKYFSDLKRFINYLKKINGKKIVIINPEYNENGMSDSKMFDALQVKTIKMLHKIKDTMVGVCPGDFGDYKVNNDIQNWKFFEKSLKNSAKESDFIAFQEMRAVTRNTKEEILNTPLRSLYFTRYLHKTYKKPVFLAYVAISSYKALDVQADVFKNYAKLMPQFKKAGLIGINLFNYIDVPTHTGYFNEAEKYFGIKYCDGERKPSFYEFKKIK